MEILKKKSIVVLSIVRNAEFCLCRNIPVIKILCSYFEEYRVFVYENDSIDKTKEILRKWSFEDSKVIVDLNDCQTGKTIPSSAEVSGVNPFFSRKRILKMAELRNHYMDFLDSMSWKPDYVVVVDLDVAKLELTGILNSFMAEHDWDAVTAFGFSVSPKLKRRYHDTYALTLWDERDEPQTEFKIKKYAEELGKLNRSNTWLHVASAFGGLAIYKYDAICGLRYSVMDNDDSRVEVRCEHFSLYKQMISRGYDKIFINPSMCLKYQKLSLKIIINSVLRKIEKNQNL